MALFDLIWGYFGFICTNLTFFGRYLALFDAILILFGLISFLKVPKEAPMKVHVTTAQARKLRGKCFPNCAGGSM